MNLLDFFILERFVSSDAPRAQNGRMKSKERFEGAGLNWIESEME